MSDTALVDGSSSPPRQTIVGPLPCVKCLYDLAGLMDDQKCPECGTPVCATIGGIATAKPETLIRLRRGLRFVALPMILGPLWLFTAQVFAMWFAFGGMGGSSGDLFWIIRLYAVPVVSIGLTVLSAIGWVTTRRALIASDMTMPPHAERLPLLAWAFAALYAITEIGPALMFPILPVLPFGLMLPVLYALTLLTWLLRTIVGFRLLRDFADGLELPRLGRVIHVFVWIAALSGGLALTIGWALEVGEVSGLEYIGAFCAVCYIVALFGLAVSVLLVRRRLGLYLIAARARAVTAETPVSEHTPVMDGAR